jgi:dihydroorotate dehydrogenase
MGLYLLPGKFNKNKELQKEICSDYERFAIEGMPQNIETYILEKYKIDISSKYGELNIKNPFGIASGQLSTNINQIENGISDGVGFIVLKTVISEDGLGNSSMKDWKINEPKMVIEEIRSQRGELGYTTTWKGRGWHKSFEEYLELMEKSLLLSKESSVPVIPSCKFNLPQSQEQKFNNEEYCYTMEKFSKVWEAAMGSNAMYLEKDFSPTLAGSSMSKVKDTILWWLKEVPSKIREFSPNGKIFLGVKLMNATFDDDFQIEMFKTILNTKDRPDYLICLNRLFDSEKVFEGKKGVAYGGYDLSDRNLKTLKELRRLECSGEIKVKDVPISATGNICSGKMMLEYALRGCQNGQIHTYFQIPSENYGMKKGTRVSKALLELMLNPETGLVPGLQYLWENEILERSDGIIKFQDVVNLWKQSNIITDGDED